MATTEGKPKWLAVTAVSLIAGVTLVLHARSYPPLTYDDAYISLRYAQRLLEGYGLTWTDGPPVEGYSNLLWVLGCALLGALGVDLLDAPIVLGIASALATLAAVIYAFPPRSWATSLPALGGTMFIALAAPIGLWAVAGLEGCLVAAELAWALALIRPWLDRTEVRTRDLLLPGIPLALLCLTRPDGPLVAVAICGFLLIRARSRDGLRRAFGVGLLPAVATLGQLGFRIAYYGDWLPNTAHAKVALTTARLADGLECVGDAAASAYALWLPAAFALYVAWRDPKRRPRVLLALTVFAVWTAYAATITCQPFGYRMLIPSYVALVYLVAEALAWAQERRDAVQAIAWATTLAALLVFGRAQQRDKNVAIVHWRKPPVNQMAETIGLWLREAFEPDDPLVAVDAAGAIPYFSGFRSIDMLGLNDAHIARHHDDSFGQGVQGHELGDGAYVLSREPDIIVAGVLGSSQLSFRGGREMADDPRFDAWYQRVRVRGEEPVPTRFNIFVHRGGRVGVERSQSRVRIPGYLFASKRGVEAQLHGSEDAVLGSQFLGAVEGRLEGIEVPPGAWRISAEGVGHLRATVRAASASAAVFDDGVLVLDRPSPVALAVRGEPGAFLTGVILTRERDPDSTDTSYRRGDR